MTRSLHTDPKGCVRCRRAQNPIDNALEIARALMGVGDVADAHTEELIAELEEAQRHVGEPDPPRTVCR